MFLGSDWTLLRPMIIRDEFFSNLFGGEEKKTRLTRATPRRTSRILLRIMTPTRARLICRDMTAISSEMRCTDGRKETSTLR